MNGLGGGCGTSASWEVVLTTVYQYQARSGISSLFGPEGRRTRAGRDRGRMVGMFALFNLYFRA